MNEVKHLLKKEIAQELSNKSQISGLLLYVASTVYVCYLSFQKAPAIPLWNALFWIICLFAAFNASARSFEKESEGRDLFLSQLVSPKSVFIAKSVFNILLINTLNILALAIYCILLGTEHVANTNWLLLLVGIVVGSSGIAVFITLLSGISFKTNNNIGLTAILGIPVIIPLLLTLIKYSKNVLDQIDFSLNYKYLLVMLVLNALVWVLGIALFPYIWRD